MNINDYYKSCFINYLKKSNNIAFYIYIKNARLLIDSYYGFYNFEKYLNQINSSNDLNNYIKNLLKIYYILNFMHKKTIIDSKDLPSLNNRYFNLYKRIRFKILIKCITNLKISIILDLFIKENI